MVPTNNYKLRQPALHDPSVQPGTARPHPHPHPHPHPQAGIAPDAHRHTCPWTRSQPPPDGPWGCYCISSDPNDGRHAGCVPVPWQSPLGSGKAPPYPPREATGASLPVYGPDLKLLGEEAGEAKKTQWSPNCWGGNEGGEEQGCGDDGSSGQKAMEDGGLCHVCGDTASGNFFSAIVCLPCKSFFIRCTKEGDGEIQKVCQGSCDVRKEQRHRCQYCRYQRCKLVGMARKKKPEIVVAGKGERLCRVCGDLANGIHFGVFTCEGCKKFFRRGLNEHDGYVCRSKGRCFVNPRNRNNCRYCRYQRCLAVGMSRGAILMGRPRKCCPRNIDSNTSSSSTTSSPAPVKDAPDAINGDLAVLHTMVLQREQDPAVTVKNPASLHSSSGDNNNNNNNNNNSNNNYKSQSRQWLEVEPFHTSPPCTAVPAMRQTTRDSACRIIADPHTTAPQCEQDPAVTVRVPALLHSSSSDKSQPRQWLEVEPFHTLPPCTAVPSMRQSTCRDNAFYPTAGGHTETHISFPLRHRPVSPCTEGSRVLYSARRLADSAHSSNPAAVQAVDPSLRARCPSLGSAPSPRTAASQLTAGPGGDAVSVRHASPVHACSECRTCHPARYGMMDPGARSRGQAHCASIHDVKKNRPVPVHPKSKLRLYEPTWRPVKRVPSIGTAVPVNAAREATVLPVPVNNLHWQRCQPPTCTHQCFAGLAHTHSVAGYDSEVTESKSLLSQPGGMKEHSKCLVDPANRVAAMRSSFTGPVVISNAVDDSPHLARRVNRLREQHRQRSMCTPSYFVPDSTASRHEALHDHAMVRTNNRRISPVQKYHSALAGNNQYPVSRENMVALVSPNGVARTADCITRPATPDPNTSNKALDLGLPRLVFASSTHNSYMKHYPATCGQERARPLGLELLQTSCGRLSCSQTANDLGTETPLNFSVSNCDGNVACDLTIRPLDLSGQRKRCRPVNRRHDLLLSHS